MDIISKASGIHVLAHSEDKIGQLGGGAVEILGPFNLDCLLCKDISCWGYGCLGGTLSLCGCWGS